LPEWPVRFDLRIDTEDLALYRTLVRAEALARAINGMPVPPHVRSRLNRLNIVRAVRGTTGIEGSRLTEDEVDRILGTQATQRALPESRAREEQEARNAERVLRFVAETLDSDRDQPVTEALIRELHRLTTDGIQYPHNTPGRYRDHAATAGDYVPPRDADEVRRLMSEFVRWLNEPPATRLHPVVRAIAAHFYLVSIHPFGDGNGRTARSVESFLLYQARMNALGFYSLANFYYTSRGEYVAMLDRVRFESGGDLTPFVRFAAEGLLAELEIVYDEVLREARIIAFRDYAREVIQSQGKLGTPAGDRMLMFLYGLGDHELDLQEVRSGRHPASVAYSKVSPKTMSRDLAFLEEHELVVRAAGMVRANLEVMDQFRT
jgi:Fic family protein